jgi:hypothetical protein
VWAGQTGPPAAASWLAALWALAGCAERPVQVGEVGVRPANLTAPFALGAVSVAQNPAVGRLRQRGVLGETNESSPLQLDVAVWTRDRSVGVCAVPDPGSRGRCARWISPPGKGAGPFAPAVAYGLALRFIDRPTGEVVYAINARLDGGRRPPPAVERRLVDAAIDCAGCAGGSLAGGVTTGSAPAR